MAEKTVLLVESNSSIRSATERSLKGFGFDVHAAANPREASSLLQEHSFDVAVVYFTTPLFGKGISEGNLNFMQELARGGVRVIAHCGFALEKNPRTVDKLNTDGIVVLEKPSDPDRMTELIESEEAFKQELPPEQAKGMTP